MAKETCEYLTQEYLDSPDRVVLTPTGIRNLLQIGEKALSALIDRGLPKIITGNSYRFSREAVLRWLADEGDGMSHKRGSSPTRKGPLGSGGATVAVRARSPRRPPTETKPSE